MNKLMKVVAWLVGLTADTAAAYGIGKMFGWISTMVLTENLYNSKPVLWWVLFGIWTVTYVVVVVWYCMAMPFTRLAELFVDRMDKKKKEVPDKDFDDLFVKE